MFRSKNPRHYHLSNNCYENLKTILHFYIEKMGPFSSEAWVNIYKNKRRHIPQYDNFHIGMFPNLLRNELTGMYSFLLLICVLTDLIATQNDSNKCCKRCHTMPTGRVSDFSKGQLEVDFTLKMKAPHSFETSLIFIGRHSIT